MAEEPNSGLTFKKFTQAVQNWLEAHPSFKEKIEELEALAIHKRVSLTAGGRVRILHDAVDKILRQAINTPIQGTAAEIVRDDLIEIGKRLRAETEDSALVLQVHDELLVEYREDEEEVVAKIMREVMTRTREINGKKFNLQVDAEVGTHWGAMDNINLETMVVTVGSKHA